MNFSGDVTDGSSDRCLAGSIANFRRCRFVRDVMTGAACERGSGADRKHKGYGYNSSTKARVHVASCR